VELIDGHREVAFGKQSFGGERWKLGGAGQEVIPVAEEEDSLLDFNVKLDG
jgi:hypothetical protein